MAEDRIEDEICDISNEIQDLEEIKDIRDELKMIERVLDDQMTVCEKYENWAFRPHSQLIRDDLSFRLMKLKRLSKEAESVEASVSRPL